MGIAILRVPRRSRRDQWERDVLAEFSDNVTDAGEIRQAPGNYLLSLHGPGPPLQGGLAPSPGYQPGTPHRAYDLKPVGPSRRSTMDP
jgi:hypothetical protein